MTNSPRRRPIRTVHLLGGLRAYDVPRQGVEVGQNHLIDFSFKDVEYATLYKVLESLGLIPIGVSFIEMREQISGVHPADFEMVSPEGFSAMKARREWSNIAASAVRTTLDSDVESLARRISTYLRLSSWRLMQVSEAYYRTCYEPRAEAAKSGEIPAGGFENQWTWELQTTIHGFLADVATLRDVLAEAVWKLVVKDDQHDVLTMGSLMKKAKSHESPFVQSFIALGEEGGWLGNLTDLRNETTHVVPVNGFHEQFLCFLRGIPVQGGRKIAQMHCPLTTDSWGLRRDADRNVDWKDDKKARASIDRYRAYVSTSGDALEYCWRTVRNLAEWAEKLRLEAGLKADTPIITDADLANATIVMD